MTLRSYGSFTRVRQRIYYDIIEPLLPLNPNRLQFFTEHALEDHATTLEENSCAREVLTSERFSRVG